MWVHSDSGGEGGEGGEGGGEGGGGGGGEGEGGGGEGGGPHADRNLTGARGFLPSGNESGI